MADLVQRGPCSCTEMSVLVFKRIGRSAPPILWGLLVVGLCSLSLKGDSSRACSSPELTQATDSQEPNPGTNSQRPPANNSDPFADLSAPPPGSAPEEPKHPRIHAFFSDNFGFRKEIMSEFDTTQ